ncbi:MAG: glycosyltransferase family 2 protein [Planctomycetes bacterium]|nr:glycosyltransferase family 2 protein [Planctomycetota bacterium]
MPINIELPVAVYYFIAFLWGLTVLQGMFLLRGGVRFLQYVRRTIREADQVRDATGRFRYQPRATVILPCCGVDEKLHKTVESLSQQNFDDYEVIFTLESNTDPAYAAVEEWTKNWVRPRRMVVAGLAERCGQKIHNLLAAVATVSPDREVFVFLDSDAIPHKDWLGFLVAPLRDQKVGAATGFRWYSAAGGWANGIRSCWNAGSLTLITDENMSFVWGGSTAIRRETFERVDIAGKWQNALSDDYQVTRAMHESGMTIRFVPQALIPSHESTTFAPFWTFARRQLVITRVCGPTLWRFAFILCMNFVIGGTAVALLFFAGLFGWILAPTAMWYGLAGWVVVMGISCLNALLRQLAIRLVLRPPDVTWRDFVWDVGGVNLSGMLHLGLLVSSMTSRRFVWRNTVYELVSPDETRILARLGKNSQAS